MYIIELLFWNWIWLEADKPFIDNASIIVRRTQYYYHYVMQDTKQNNNQLMTWKLSRNTLSELFIWIGLKRIDVYKGWVGQNRVRCCSWPPLCPITSWSYHHLILSPLRLNKYEAMLKQCDSWWSRNVLFAINTYANNIHALLEQIIH